MKKNILFIIHFCLFTFAGVLANAQEYTVEVFITNQPDNRIVFGSVKGDDFTQSTALLFILTAGRLYFDLILKVTLEFTELYLAKPLMQK